MKKLFISLFVLFVSFFASVLTMNNKVQALDNNNLVVGLKINNEDFGQIKNSEANYVKNIYYQVPKDTFGPIPMKISWSGASQDMTCKVKSQKVPYCSGYVGDIPEYLNENNNLPVGSGERSVGAVSIEESTTYEVSLVCRNSTQTIGRTYKIYYLLPDYDPPTLSSTEDNITYGIKINGIDKGTLTGANVKKRYVEYISSQDPVSVVLYWSGANGRTCTVLGDVNPICGGYIGKAEYLNPEKSDIAAGTGEHTLGTYRLKEDRKVYDFSIKCAKGNEKTIGINYRIDFVKKDDLVTNFDDKTCIAENQTKTEDKSCCSGLVVKDGKCVNEKNDQCIKENENKVEGKNCCTGLIVKDGKCVKDDNEEEDDDKVSFKLIGNIRDSASKEKIADVGSNVKMTIECSDGKVRKLSTKDGYFIYNINNLPVSGCKLINNTDALMRDNWSVADYKYKGYSLCKDSEIGSTTASCATNIISKNSWDMSTINDDSKYQIVYYYDKLDVENEPVNSDLEDKIDQLILMIEKILEKLGIGLE